jgi:hypothetical protein
VNGPSRNRVRGETRGCGAPFTVARIALARNAGYVRSCLPPSGCAVWADQLPLWVEFTRS